MTKVNVLKLKMSNYSWVNIRWTVLNIEKKKRLKQTFHSYEMVFIVN